MLKQHLESLRKSLASELEKSEPANTMKNLLPFGIVNGLLLLHEKENVGTNFEQVGKFMEVMSQEVHTQPHFPDEQTLQLRLNLIREEVKELEVGVEERDLENVAKELTDILYVVYGMGHALGINLDKTFAVVQESNMSKLDDDGKPIRRESDGKVLKGPNYRPPDMSFIYEEGA